MSRFVDEYWILVEALIEHAADLLGVASANRIAAELGYPFGAALTLSCAGFAIALFCLALRRPGWGLAGLALGEELSALALAGAAFAHGFAFDGALAVARVAAAALAVYLVSLVLRRSLKPAREKAPAALETRPAS